MVRRPARRLGINTSETQGAKIQTLDKGLDHTNRVLLLNKIITCLGKKRALAATQALDKPLHLHPSDK